MTAASRDVWRWLRSRPAWAQALAWLLLWWVLPALWLRQWRGHPRLGRTLAAVFLLLVTVSTAATLAGGVADVATSRPNASAPATAGLPAGLDTQVTSIVDGDTLHVADLPERVRLVGIDTPETRHPREGVECYGREATAHLAGLVPPGTAVRVEFDVQQRDRYGRPLGHVRRASDGLLVNLAMVRDGYAQVDTVPPNVTYAGELLTAQRDAREAGRGLWGACPV
ncbi:MAG: thermonuclease family protein [Actinobacteria bacterium]|nr:thermonuclease family protein [Actinomycetota bacterium]